MPFERLHELLNEGEGPPGRTVEARPIVLIVDDDEHIRTAMSILLSDRYETWTAASGAAGIEVCDDRVAAVILDIKMAGLDGFETSRGIRDKCEDVPIIFHTAYQDTKDPFTVLNEYRPFGYVVKGSDPQRLLHTLESAVAYFAKLRENHALVANLREMNLTLERRVEERTQQLEDSLAQVTRLTVMDVLTELANRRHFFQTLEQELRRVDRHRGPLCLLLIDIDDMRRINQRFGHAIGDQVLRQVAQTLRHHARSVDTLGRVGGEEFGLILPATDQGGAETAATRLAGVVRALAIPEAPGEVMTVSIGGCLLAEPPSPRGELLYQAADRALLEAKQKPDHRIQFVRHEPS